MVLNLQAVEQSVQSTQDFPYGTDGYGLSFYYRQGFDILPPWGTRLRDLELRRFWINAHNTLSQGALANLIMRIWSTPYEIVGGRRKVFEWDDVMRNSEFSQGYETMMSMFLLDYFTQSNGGFLEIIAGGAADTAIGGRPVLGVAQLDALNSYATGNPEYPVAYYDWYTGEYHRMHYTRVRRMVDMPSPDRRAFGRGTSAMERGIAVSQSQILLSRHQQELLNNQPPTGMVTVSGIHPQQYDDAKKRFRYDAIKDGNTIWPGIMELQAIEPGQEIKVNFIPFSQVPEGFSYKDFMEQHVNLLALAYGVDPQDIWPLTGAPLGTGTQSKILDAKGRAKAYGSTLTRLERLFNGLMPKSLEFKYKPNDSEADKADADNAQVWVSVASSLKAVGASTEQALQLMANQVEAFADVLLDESGLLRLQDDDPKDEQEAEQAVIADDTTPPTPEGQTPDTTAAAPSDNQQPDNSKPNQSDKQPPDMGSGDKSLGVGLGRGGIRVDWKDFDDTAEGFADDLGDLIQGGLDDEISRRRFGTVMRAQLRNYGQQAYKDGLEYGGVDSAEMDDADREIFNTWLTEQSSYVTSFANSLFSEDSTINDVSARVRMWVNKSLADIYSRAIAEADRNGMYEFEGDDGAESCDTCQRLKGQIHRLKDINRRNLNPKLAGFVGECGGYNCNHEWVKTKGKARGSW